MADGSHLPIILIEVVLVFGGVLLFGWWQLRSVKRDQQALRARKASAEAEAERMGDKTAPMTPARPPEQPPPR